MCGIIAILSSRVRRPLPDLTSSAARLATATDGLRAWLEADPTSRDGHGTGLEAYVLAAESAASDLRGLAGLRSLLSDPASLVKPVQDLVEITSLLETRLDQDARTLGHVALELANSQLVRLKDAVFYLRNDRLGNLPKVRRLARASESGAYLRVAYDLNVALNALDRIEVRGRDSAGIHLYVRGSFGALPEALEADLARRGPAPAFNNGSVRRETDASGRPYFSFVYKVAAEVGELGANVEAIREAIATDDLLAYLLSQPEVTADILGHTRWASVGAINEANAHPLNHELLDPDRLPSAVAALNGDVDNYRALIEEASITMPEGITTDAKVIPVFVSKAIASGKNAPEAFRGAVRRFEGSVAVGVSIATDPGKLYLALRGSGQALYVGLAEDSFIVASEPYGIVEETSVSLRMDGETPADPSDPSSRGQILVLDATHAGELAGVTRVAYDGTPLPLSERDLKRIEITTRDIDRGSHRHFLHKEICEAPESVRKTLRGRIVEDGNGMRASLGDVSFPPALRQRLQRGEIRRIRVIGQGTAAVAGMGVAAAIEAALQSHTLTVDAIPATEVSGFHLAADMSHELYVAISQSGTTTDTNRAVDLLRSRGAAVLAIVNRRHSDLTERVDGVIYTSDGRDVEMSVASTKAFYSQIAAGFLLADEIAQACGTGDATRRAQRLEALVHLPETMRELLTREDDIARVAAATAPFHRYWALVGNGPNRVAAEEIRIKLSELCYKAIACDTTEDKKHIDLSSEPLILICAAGLEGGTAADVGKEVEIFAAHKAHPIVIASDASREWRGAAATIHVPDVDRDLAFILSTMAGHLFGYHGAQAIDLQALPLRAARGRLDGALAEKAGDNADDSLRGRLRERLQEPYLQFSEGLRKGAYDGCLGVGSATRLTELFRYATGRIPLEFFAEDFGVPGTPATIVEQLTQALTHAIDDLTRPIDAIRHQAKTVTVGTSRGDEELFAARLVRSVLDAGVPREHLAYDDLRLLQALEPAVADVTGRTRYAIERPASGSATIRVVAQSGSAEGLRSRTSGDATLRGTKNTVAKERHALIAVGRGDGRPIVLVPELVRGTCVGLVLLHVAIQDDLDVATIRSVLTGYHDHYGRIRDAVTETNVLFEDADLLPLGILSLLTAPVLVTADRLVEAKTAQSARE